MRELNRYKVTYMVTVDLVAFDYREAVGCAFDEVNDMVSKAMQSMPNMRIDNVRITGLSRDMDGDDMVYCYDSVKGENNL